MSEFDLGSMPYVEWSAFHKGAFQALLATKNMLERLQRNQTKKYFNKKQYTLMISYLTEACHNVDEYLVCEGLPNVLVDKDNHCKRITSQEAEAFRARNRMERNHV